MQELVQATALVALAPLAALAAAAWMQAASRGRVRGAATGAALWTGAAGIVGMIAAGGGLVSPSVALAVAAVGAVLGAVVGARAVRQR